MMKESESGFQLLVVLALRSEMGLVAKLVVRQGVSKVNQSGYQLLVLLALRSAGRPMIRL